MHTTIRANTQRWIALVLLISAFCLAAIPMGSQAQTGSVQADAASSKRVPMSHLYVTLSDAMAESKSGRDEQAKAHLIELQNAFNAIQNTTQSQTVKGQAVNQAIAQAINHPQPEQLSALSNALYAFEQEQNPVDYSAKRQAFKKQMVPAYEQLNQAIEQASAHDAASLKAAYQQFNAAWLGNERVVRNTSMGHYGQMETAMALMRVALETAPLDLDKIRQQSQHLKSAIDSYNSGETVAAASSTYDFNGGVQLLRDGLGAFRSGQLSQGQEKLTTFITIWPNIEGEVSTRNPSLYSRVENQIPVILAHGNDAVQQNTLSHLIDELEQINPQAQYGAMDAMLILLREGVEALLIVMALVSALNVARQPQGKKWIYGGVVAGLIASVLGALALQKLFPAVSAGASREKLEGFVGIAAVLMMLMVGAWLHSKSSIQSWNAYIKKHMGKALSTGSLISLFGLSFLAVFREGAETIVFYAGILPKISTQAFLSGIVAAIVLLLGLAWLMAKTSVTLPVAKMFRILTWLIYALGFKILGISLHALQLTGIVPMTPLPSTWLERNALGIYPTIETLAAQALYIGLIVVIQFAVHRSIKNIPDAVHHKA